MPYAATSAQPAHASGTFDLGDGLTDIGWFDEDGQPMTPEAWEFAEGRLLACRRVCQCGDGSLDATLLLEWAAGLYWHASQLGTPSVLSQEQLGDVVEQVGRLAYGTKRGSE